MDLVSADYWLSHKRKGHLLKAMDPTWDSEEVESQDLLAEPIDEAHSRGILDGVRDFAVGAVTSIPKMLGNVGSIVNNVGPEGWNVGDKLGRVGTFAVGTVAGGPLGALAGYMLGKKGDEYSGDSGKGFSAYLRDSPKTLGADDSSVPFIIGDLAGTIAGMATGVGEVNAALQLGRIGKIATAAASSGLYQAVADYPGLEGVNPKVDKLTTAEYLARLAGSTAAGAATGAFFPKFGRIGTLAFDGAIGGATQGVISGGQYLFAEGEARKQQLLDRMPEEIARQAAINMAIGYGLGKLPSDFAALKNKITGKTPDLPPAKPIQPVAQAIGGVDPYKQVEPGVANYISQLPPVEVAELQKRTGTIGLTPEAMASKLVADAKSTDTMNTGGGLEWLDRMLGVDWHQKGAAPEAPRVIEPIEVAQQVEQPIQQPVQQAELPPIVDPAIVPEQPVVEQPIIEQPVIEPEATPNPVIEPTVEPDVPQTVVEPVIDPTPDVALEPAEAPRVIEPVEPVIESSPEPTVIEEPITGEPDVQRGIKNDADSQSRQLQAAADELKAIEEPSASPQSKAEIEESFKVVRDRSIQEITDAWNEMNPNAVKPFKASDIEKAMRRYEDTGGVDTGNHPKLDALIRATQDSYGATKTVAELRLLEDAYSRAREGVKNVKNSEFKNSEVVQAALAGEEVSVHITNFKSGRALREIVSILERSTGQKIPPKFTASDGEVVFTSGDTPLAVLKSNRDSKTVSLQFGEALQKGDEILTSFAASQQIKKQFGTADPDIAEMFGATSNIDKEDVFNPKADNEGAGIVERSQKSLQRENSRQRRDIEKATDRIIAEREIAETPDSKYEKVQKDVISAAKRDGIDLTPEAIDNHVDLYDSMIEDGRDPSEVTQFLNDEISLGEVAKLSKIRKEAVSRAEAVNDIARELDDSAQQLIVEDVPLTPKQKRDAARAAKQARGPGDGALIAKSVLGMLPRTAAENLEDDEYYLPGLSGKTIKAMATVMGGFMMVSAGRKMVGIGSKSTPGPRSSIYEYIRRPFINKTAIANGIRENATANGLSKEQTQIEINRALREHSALNSHPFPTAITTIHTALRGIDHPYVRELDAAVAKGETEGARVAAVAKLYQDKLTSLPEGIKEKVSAVNYVEDYEKSAILAKRTPEDAGIRDVTDDVIADLKKWDEKKQAELRQSDPELLDAYLSVKQLRDNTARAEVEAMALEHTGYQIDEGIRYHNDLVKEYVDLGKENLANYRKLERDPEASDVAKSDALHALKMVDLSAKQALRVRNELMYFRDFRELSVARGYMPRWFDNANAPYRVRVKQTLADPGDILAFKNEEDMSKFLEMMNKETPNDQLFDAKHPITGEPVTSRAELYRVQGGSVHVMDKADVRTSDASVNPGAIRALIEEFANAAGPNGNINSDRAAAFFKAYGSDIANLIDAKSLADIGLTSDIASKGLTNAAQLRQLINKIAMPSFINNFAHRSNVHGYAPLEVDPITGKANPNFLKEIHEWELAGLEHRQINIRRKVANASITRVANAQAADLVSRGIAPRYVKFLSHVVSGVRWKDTAASEYPSLSKADKYISSAIVLKMMAFNGPSNIKNYGLGYVNEAAEAAVTTGNPLKAAKLVAAADIKYVKYLKDHLSKQEFTSLLRDPSMITDLTSNMNSAFAAGGDNLKKVVLLARKAGLFEAQNIRSIERTLPDVVKTSKTLRYGEKAALGGYELVEDHNRGASFIAGAMHHLSNRPNDLEGAMRAGYSFMTHAQGNYAAYAKSALERKLLSIPGARTLMTMSTSAIRSTEQLAIHLAAAAGRPQYAKVWAPILSAVTVLSITTGLEGAPLYGDYWKFLNFFADAISKDDADLRAIKENTPEAIKRWAVGFAKELGVDPKIMTDLYESVQKGYMSKITGRNLAAANNVSDMVIDGIAASQYDAIVRFAEKFPTADAQGKLREFLKLTTVAGARANRSIENYSAGRQLDRSGKNKVGRPYGMKEALLDFVVGSKLEDSEAGQVLMSKGGELYDSASSKDYVESLKGIPGLKLSPRNESYFLVKDPDFKKLQYSTDKVNKFRERVLDNYDKLKPAQEAAVEKFKATLADPRNRERVIDFALDGQQASRTNDDVSKKEKQVLQKVKSFFVAKAVSQSFKELGLPEPYYQHGNSQFGAAMQFMLRQEGIQRKKAARERSSGVYYQED